MWANPIGSHTGAQSGDNLFINLAGGIALYPRMWIDQTGSLTWQFRVNGATKAISSAQSITPNVWHHIVLQYDPTNGSGVTWIDNTVRNRTNVGLGSLTMSMSGPMMFGRDNNQNQCYSGLMDDIRVYNRFLSGGEIGSLFSKINVNGSLIFYLKLDEGSSVAGSFVYSSASGGNSVIQPFLGDRRNSLVLAQSGGYY